MTHSLGDLSSPTRDWIRATWWKHQILALLETNREGFPGGPVAKNPSAMQETLVRSLGWEDPLEKEMAAYSSILAWEISWIEEPGGL